MSNDESDKESARANLTDELLRELEASRERDDGFWKHLTMLQATVVGLTVGIMGMGSGRTSGVLLAACLEKAKLIRAGKEKNYKEGMDGTQKIRRHQYDNFAIITFEKQIKG